MDNSFTSVNTQDVFTRKIIPKMKNEHTNSNFPFTCKGLHVVNLNVQHFLPKYDELKFHIMSQANSIDIIGFCETFLTENTSDAIIRIPNYVFERKDRKDKKGGGILLYVKNNIRYKRRLDLESEYLESVWIEVFSKNKTVFNMFRVSSAG